LGFEFNPQFTNDNAASMIISSESYVMLLREEFFKTFLPAGKQLCDTASQVEGLFCLSCESRTEGDELVKTALAAGGKPAMKPQDHGFMYCHSFFDLDGHHWEVMWMDPAAIQ